MKVIRLLTIFIFLMAPFMIFTEGSPEAGSNTTQSTTKYQDPWDTPAEGETPGPIGGPGLDTTSDTSSDDTTTSTATDDFLVTTTIEIPIETTTTTMTGGTTTSTVPVGTTTSTVPVGTTTSTAGTTTSTSSDSDSTPSQGGVNNNDDTIQLGDTGMAQVPGESGELESSSTSSTGGTLGSGTASQAAVLKTVGTNNLRFSDLVGYNFGTGKVKDLVLTQDGTVQYVVVNMNNTEGDFLVPPEMISLESTEGGVRATFNFGAGGTGSMTQLQGGANDQMGNAAASASPGAVFASSLVKYDVLSSGNEKVAKVDDIVFDIQSGKVAYLAIAEGGFLGIGQNLLAVSLEGTRIDPQNGTVMLNLSTDELKNAKSFDKANWPSQAELGVSGSLGSGDTTGASTSTTETTTSSSDTTMSSSDTTTSSSDTATSSSDTTTTTQQSGDAGTQSGNTSTY